MLTHFAYVGAEHSVETVAASLHVCLCGVEPGRLLPASNDA